MKAVIIHEFEDKDLSFVRDIFVFVCLTALSFVDVKELTTDDIVEVNGDKWIVSIADIFGLPEASIFRAIRSIYRKGELYEHGTMERIPFPRQESKGWTIDVYNLDMIIYLTYKLPSRNARVFRKYMTNKAYERSPYEHICIIVDDVDFRASLRNKSQTE